MLKEMGSTGKSGSIFYFTTNFKYIIKSVADHEMVSDAHLTYIFLDAHPI